MKLIRTTALLFLLILIGFVLTSGLLKSSNSLSASLFNSSRKTVSLEGFAKCLNRQGVKLYGAKWDGHTQNQKWIFKEASEYLPYVECMKKEKDKLAPRCKQEGIKAFPTWEFSNGTRKIGELSLQEIQELSDCSLW